MFEGLEETLRPPDPPPIHRDPGLVLPIAALIIPVVAGIVELFLDSVPAVLAVSFATVFITAFLMAIDARRLAATDINGQSSSPLMVFLMMIGVWIIGYPAAFFRRRKFGGPNLGIPAILVALFFLGAPILHGMMSTPELPACDSPEVKKLIEQMIRQDPIGPQVRSITGHRETVHDQASPRREGKCVVDLDGEKVVVSFTITWRDREKGLFEVRINP